MHHISAVPQQFLLLIADNLTLAGCLGWKWSLWPVQTWLAVTKRKAVFLLNLYDSINDMKLFWPFSITPQPCHSHFFCWLLPIWPKLDVCAENVSYGLCRLRWWYNAANLSFPGLIWYYQLYKTLLNCLHHTSAVSQQYLLLIPANLAQAGFMDWKCSLWPVPAWLNA